MVFVKKSMRECFEDIKTTSVGAGILGLMVREHLNSSHGHRDVTFPRATKVVPPFDSASTQSTHQGNPQRRPF